MAKDQSKVSSGGRKFKLSFSRKNLSVLGLIIFVVILLGVSIYFYLESQKVSSKGDGKSVEVEKLVDEVGSIIDLPKDEIPQVATVSDKSKLSDQAFFRKAENGDKVLIYSNSKKAILYRPSMKKIIDVTTIDLGDVKKNEENSGSQSASVSAAPSIKQLGVVIYNGTKVVGLAARAERDILGSGMAFGVINKTNSTADFEETLVVDLKGTNKDKALELSKFLDGKVGKLPEGEVKPDADLLIILGADFAE